MNLINIKQLYMKNYLSINNIYIGKSIVLPESNPIIIVNISAKLLDNE